MKNRIYINQINNKFKINIFYTNYRDIMKMLLNKKITYQIIHFTFLKFFIFFKKNLTFRFLTIYKHYFNLLNTLLLYFEKNENKQINSRLFIINDINHKKLIMINYL